MGRHNHAKQRPFTNLFSNKGDMVKTVKSVEN